MKIAEIFTSIQGEGSYSGYPTVFVRLSGCNLTCVYCDTPSAQKSNGREMKPNSVAGTVFASGITHVCITGGEPLLQEKELRELVVLLKQNGNHVTIETNGTLDFRAVQEFSTICMDVKCPSSGAASNLALLDEIRDIDSVKFVIGSDEDLSYAIRVVKEHHIVGTVFFSPVFGTDPRPIASAIIEQKLMVRFQVQLHKVIGVQ